MQPCDSVRREGGVTSSKSSGKSCISHDNCCGRLPNPDIDRLPIVLSFATLSTLGCTIELGLFLV